jgi:hypothetical protein
MRSPSWRSTLRVIAILSWIVSILWLIFEPRFEPLLAFLGGAAVFLGSFAASDAPISTVLEYKPTSAQRGRNRHAMLELVKNAWVKGVLEQSLHGAAMIELGLEKRADAVEKPWDMVLQMPDRPNRQLPPGTRMVNVFDEMSQALLILGEPGSGKTTMLLDLTRDAICRAEKDPTLPIPVVFNLSSWAEKRQPIAEWLMDELNTKYNIPKRIARPWVENDELLLLLDGLDEVKPKYREACVKAINAFRLIHLVPLAICSRIADYEMLTTRLRLQGAVLLQPLTSQQITEYLDRAGDELSAVRRMYYDVKFQELVQSPLMLSVMTLAYRGMSVEDLGVFDTVEARRKHVFEVYVRRMFKRRSVRQPYPPQRTIHWLTWLAQEMTRHSQTMFLIERMQPTWLQTDAQRLGYQIIVTLLYGLLFGLSGGLLFGLPYGLLVGLLVGLLGGWAHLTDPPRDTIEPVEVVKWKWTWENGRWIAPLWGLICGLLFGLSYGLLYGLLVVLILTPIFALLIALSVEPSSTEIGMKTTPNQGVWQSAINAVMVGLLYGVTLGLMLMPCSVPFFLGLTYWLKLVLVFALIGGVNPGGGKAFIQHFTFRFVLYRNGYLPWNLVRFLDYAAERIFLRKVGGGYIFVHRTLMEHFASLASQEARKAT